MVATDQIIKELCIEVGDPGFFNYTTIMGGVIDGIRDLNIFNMPSASHAVLDINNYNSVEWPCGVVKPLSTFLLRDGKCVILDIDDSLLATYPERRDEGIVMSTDNQIEDAFRIDGYHFGWPGFFTWGIGELYGLTSYMAYGFVSHNRNLRQSTIKGNCLKSTDQVILFYITDGLDECPMYVPSECKTAIEHYALYKYFRTRNPSLGQANLKDYKENFTRINKFNTGDDEHTWTAAMLSNNKSTPK